MSKPHGQQNQASIIDMLRADLWNSIERERRIADDYNRLVREVQELRQRNDALQDAMVRLRAVALQNHLWWPGPSSHPRT